MVIEPAYEAMGKSAEGLMGYKPLYMFGKAGGSFPGRPKIPS